METLSIVAFGTLNIVCIFIGRYLGKREAGKKDMPSVVNPVKVLKKHKESKEEQYERQRTEIIMRNIDRYDGTSMGQEDVPGRW